MIENQYAAASWYDHMTKDRQGPLRRAREASKLTIPFVMPDEGQTSSTDFPKLYQSVGARGVNNLASKLLTSLLPPNTPFFKLAIDKFELEKAKSEAGDEGVEELETEINRALSLVEQAVVTEVEAAGVRVHMYEALRQLIVCGNVLFFVPRGGDGAPRVYKMDSYVIRRDPDGSPRKIVIREAIAREEAPEGIDLEHNEGCPECDKSDKLLYLYTVVSRVDSKWEVHQELNGQVVEESKGSYPKDKCPYIPVRFNKIDGEDWGEGFVSEYIGDLNTLEGLREAIAMASAAASKVIFLVRPGSGADPRVLTTTPNGGFAEGTEEDVKPLQLAKQADMAVAQSVAAQIQEDLERSFLLNTSIQRSGERVTAEEIRYMAQELENGIGGIHSILSSDFSRPLVSTLMERMSKDQRLPKLPKDIVKTQIVTGIDAIGRGNDLQNLRIFVQEAVAVLGPDGFARYLNATDFLTRLSTATGVDQEGLIKSEAMIKQEQAEAQQAAMTQAAAPEMVKQAGNVVSQQLQQ